MNNVEGRSSMGDNVSRIKDSCLPPLLLQHMSSVLTSCTGNGSKVISKRLGYNIQRGVKQTVKIDRRQKLGIRDS